MPNMNGCELAKKVIKACENNSKLTHPYNLEDGIVEKITKIVSKVYGGDSVSFSTEALDKIKKAEKLGFKNFPVVIAKTQYSLSDDATKLARPKNFTFNIRDIEVRGGAGFIVAVSGKIMLMPGLPSHPAAENIDVDADGNISGLF